MAEFQRRGNVYLHAIVRADGPDGSIPPLGAGQLAAACLAAARAVSVPHARGAARWGNEIDVRPLGSNSERVAKVATYLAKYATKSSSEDPRLDARITSLEELDARGLSTHLHRMAATAVELGADPDLGNLNLTRHAHRLGFGATSSPNPGVTRRPAGLCGKPECNGTRPEDTAAAYPTIG